MRKNLKEARAAAGLTQQQMADKLGLTLGHYQKIEYNKLNGSKGQRVLTTRQIAKRRGEILP